MFDPQFYVFDFAIKNELTKFLIVEEANLDAAPFIDSRFEPIAQGHFSVSTNELFSLERQHDIERPVPVFIFHHAFVCSTLLARCLNQVDAFFSLKEPWILRRLADFKRARGAKTPANQWRDMLINYTHLLAKNYKTGKTPVIKATNVASNLLSDVLRFMPDCKSLYLYSDLSSFLVSNLKKPDETKKKMPDLARSFVNDEDFFQKHPQFCDIDRLSFLEVCALIWVANLYNFNANVKQTGSDNVKTLLMDDFLGDMTNSLQALSGFFGHETTDDELDKMISPDVTETDAKHQNLDYSKQVKALEAQQVLKNQGAEISNTVDWIGPLANDLGLIEALLSRKLC